MIMMCTILKSDVLIYYIVNRSLCVFTLLTVALVTSGNYMYILTHLVNNTHIDDTVGCLYWQSPAPCSMFVVQLLPTLHNVIINISECLMWQGMSLVWESYKLDPYVQKLAEYVFGFQEKVSRSLCDC